jgi:hypothetical protein
MSHDLGRYSQFGRQTFFQNGCEAVASLTDVRCGNNKCASMIRRYPVVRKRTPWY